MTGEWTTKQYRPEQRASAHVDAQVLSVLNPAELGVCAA
jgi:hypothetical protein